MGRPRKPTQLHVVQGTHRKDRHGALPSPLAYLEPLGPPPGDWTPAAKALWHEIGAQVPLGVASKNDRVTFEILIRLVAMIREKSAALTPAMASQIRACCGAFGMTPADRARYSAPALSDDLAEKYFELDRK